MIKGFPYSWGVFRVYLFTHGSFKGVEYISVAGVMSNVSSFASEKRKAVSD
jgi:hypothetical protein